MCLYRADFFEDDEIKVLLKFRPWWEKLSPSTEQEGETGEFKSSWYKLNLHCVVWIHTTLVVKTIVIIIVISII